MAFLDPTESTRQSWNQATRNHNSHKGDQAAFFRNGGDVLFPEELALLGELGGRSLAHLQCNAGQDTLCLARRGAIATGVDFSTEAIAFARRLASESGIAATFQEAEIVSWMMQTEDRFDLAFASYGVLPWHNNPAPFFQGVSRILHKGGSLIYVEFHPLVWSLGKELDLRGDDYFFHGPYIEPVGDYVAESQAGLWPDTGAPRTSQPNTIPAYGYQHTLAEMIMACIGAGLELDLLQEYPHSNGCRVSTGLVQSAGRRWVFPEGKARVPLMFGLRAKKPA